MSIQYVKITTLTSLITSLCVALHGNAACDARQQIRVTSGDRDVERWAGASDAIHHIVLPNGFKLGMKIEETSREQYEKLLKQDHDTSIVELVRISLYDETGTMPRLITTTWGGANSNQGYSPRGGADRVDEVGGAGINVRLYKPNCLSAATIATLPTAAALKQQDEKPQPSADNARGTAAAAVDAKAGKYLVIYPRGALSEKEMLIIKSELERAGLQFAYEDDGSDTATRAFNLGYSRGMMNAIREKFGEAEMRKVEANIKVRMVESLPAAVVK